MKIREAMDNLKIKTKKRGFKQSYDLIVTIRGVDFKKPENRFSKEVVLPHGTGKDSTVRIFSDNDNIKNAFTKTDIEHIVKNKRNLRKIIKKTDFFISEAPLMVLVGKVLGRWLAPKGKMPRLIPPGQNIDNTISDLRKSVRIRLQNPVIHVIVGAEDMKEEHVIENIESVINSIKKFLPAKAQISSVYLKLTMSPVMKIEGLA